MPAGRDAVRARPSGASRRRIWPSLLLDGREVLPGRSSRTSPRAIDYLKGRGLTGEIAARFGIGYAPDGWQPLAGAFDATTTIRELETAGLVIAGDAGKRYDRFRDRIMFPIHDSRGQVIGFGGRVLGEGEPKYLNSPETPLFSKGRELYGLYLARNAIRDAGKVIVVEGYMDVVALAQHGVDYAVATLGTATTPVHAQKLLRLTDRVIFCFDGDAAGRKAAWRALENTLPVLADGKNALFLFLPDGEDPDDYIRSRGKAAFEALVEQATPLSEFLLAELSARHPPTSCRRARGAGHRRAPAAWPRSPRPCWPRCCAGGSPNSPDCPKPSSRTSCAARSRRAAEATPRRPEADADRSPSGAAPRRSAAPSLVRELIQALLLQPELARRVVVPEPDGRTPEGAALAALVEFCAIGEHPLTTAGRDAAFRRHAARASWRKRWRRPRITASRREQAAEHLSPEWPAIGQQAQRAGRPVAAAAGGDGAPSQPEETERLRQLEMVAPRAGERRTPTPRHRATKC